MDQVSDLRAVAIGCSVHQRGRMISSIASSTVSPAKSVSPAGVSTPLSSGWRKMLLIALSVLLLSAAFAPFKQFYLAWVGLVPMIFVVLASRSKKGAFFQGWLGG